MNPEPQSIIFVSNMSEEIVLVGFFSVKHSSISSCTVTMRILLFYLWLSVDFGFCLGVWFCRNLGLCFDLQFLLDVRFAFIVCYLGCRILLTIGSCLTSSECERLREVRLEDVGDSNYFTISENGPTFVQIQPHLDLRYGLLFYRS